MYVRDALEGKNAQLLDKSKLIKDIQGNIRISELTPLMVACMMSNMQTARILVEEARLVYLPHSPEDFHMFINVRVGQSLGGNNAFLYACSNCNSADNEDQANYILVKYLIDEAGADPNIMNDSF